MGLSKKIKMLLSGNSGHDFVEILSGQADFLRRSTQMLVEMFQDGLPLERRKEIEREIKALENQGDAMLTEFHGQLAANRVISVNKLDLQAISMAMDDCLDAIKDTSKAVLIYRPHRIDPQLRYDMAVELKRAWLFAWSFQLHEGEAAAGHQDEAVGHPVHAG